MFSSPVGASAVRFVCRCYPRRVRLIHERPLHSLTVVLLPFEVGSHLLVHIHGLRRRLRRRVLERVMVSASRTYCSWPLLSTARYCSLASRHDYWLNIQQFQHGVSTSDGAQKFGTYWWQFVLHATMRLGIAFGVFSFWIRG